MWSAKMDFELDYAAKMRLVFFVSNYIMAIV